MSYTRREVNPPARPVLITVFDGWIDPGYAAQSALSLLLDQLSTRTFAVFDGTDLIDHRARRARALIRHGERGRVRYLEPRLRVGRDLAGAGVALLLGPEPDYRWRPFAGEVTGLALELEVPIVIGLGAFPAPVPHTRPVAVVSTASSPELAAKVGFRPEAIDVPAGIGDVLGAYCSEAGIPSVGIWARVPHYVGAMPYLPASVVLLEMLAKLSGLTFDLAELRAKAEDSKRKIDQLIDQSEEHKAMVRQLEEQYDEEERRLGGEPGPIEEDELPSGEDLIAELERYLREEGEQ